MQHGVGRSRRPRVPPRGSRLWAGIQRAEAKQSHSLPDMDAYQDEQSPNVDDDVPLSGDQDHSGMGQSNHNNSSTPDSGHPETPHSSSSEGPYLGKFGSRRHRCSATHPGNLPGNKPAETDPTQKVKDRVLVEQFEEQLPQEYRVRPPLEASTGRELSAYINLQLGYSRISALNREVALRLVNAWFKQHRPGVSFEDREAYAAEIITRLMRENDFDRRFQQEVVSSNYFVGQRPIREEIADRIEDINFIRGGYRLEQTHWAIFTIMTILPYIILGAGVFFSAGIVFVTVNPGPLVLATAIIGLFATYEGTAWGMRNRTKYCSGRRLILPEK